MKNKIKINDFLVTTFHNIMKIEETVLVKNGSSDLTIKELHVLETIENREEKAYDNTAGTLAAKLHVTPGTLTTAVKKLEKKGYVIRQQDQDDKRSVHILPTEKGLHATQKHARFHQEIEETLMENLTDEELLSFFKGLSVLEDFFQTKTVSC